MLARRNLAVALLLLAGFAGCPDSKPAATTVVPSAHRIVAFTCGAVDVLLAMGEKDRICAVELDCPIPGTEDKVKIRNDDHPGQVQVVQVEAIMALHPDLVICKPELQEALEGRGLNVLYAPPIIDMKTLPGFVAAIASAIAEPAKGQALLDDMKAREAALRAKTEKARRVRVYYEVNGAGRSAGTSTIADAMIKLAGGESIVGDDPRPVANLSPEAVVAADPEVIILGAFAESVETVKARPGWETVSAVKNGRVYKIPELQRYVILPTPRCVQGCAEMFLPWIHPELAKGH